MLDDVQKLYGILDGIKRGIKENVAPDGTCRFNVQHMVWILTIADNILRDSINAQTTE